MSTLWQDVVPLELSHSWLARLFSSFILSSSLSAAEGHKTHFELKELQRNCCRWGQLHYLLTLCKRWRGENESSHWVGRRGRHWWGQDTTVWGGGPGQGTTGPTICARMKAVAIVVGLSVTACMCFVLKRQTLFWRQGRSLWQGAGGGSVEDPFSIFIIGRNICWWWHKKKHGWTQINYKTEKKGRIEKVFLTDILLIRLLQ